MHFRDFTKILKIFNGLPVDPRVLIFYTRCMRLIHHMCKIWAKSEFVPCQFAFFERLSWNAPIIRFISVPHVDHEPGSNLHINLFLVMSLRSPWKQIYCFFTVLFFSNTYVMCYIPIERVFDVATSQMKNNLCPLTRS